MGSLARSSEPRPVGRRPRWESVAFGASGRNGVRRGIPHAWPTHGTHVWPTQVSALQREGERNLEDSSNHPRQRDDCDLRLSGKTTIATEEWQVEGFARPSVSVPSTGSHDFLIRTRCARRPLADLPGGLRDRAGTVLVDPALLAWGMAERLEARACASSTSAARDIRTQGAGVRVSDAGHVDARQAIVATAAYRAPLRRLGSYIMPLYDHVLMTEPLTDGQWASIGWNERQGLTDSGNQFHYYRPTADGRILFGGWDAVYYRGSKVDPSLEQRDSSHRLLAQHFFETFPQLAGDVRSPTAGPGRSTDHPLHRCLRHGPQGPGGVRDRSHRARRRSVALLRRRRARSPRR